MAWHPPFQEMPTTQEIEMNTENGTYPTFLKERSTFILLWQVALNKGLETC